MHDLESFLSHLHFKDLIRSGAYKPLQMANTITALRNGNFDFEQADIILLGCGERRGGTFASSYSDAPNAIRSAFYELYNWYPNIEIADLGNLVEGASIADTKAALRIVLDTLYTAGKIVILLGGSQDLTLQQYEIFKQHQETVDAAVIDSLIDLEDEEACSDTSFLMEMLTSHPNYIRNYSHIGFQSYYTNPKMLETLDKLRFDFFRLGTVRADMDEMEPVLRSCSLLSIDINAIRRSDAPFNPKASPNGFFGDEMCQLMRYAGMSKNMRSLGIYGYNPEQDSEQQGAKLIAQMLWYFVDGYRLRSLEADLSQTDQFLMYNIHFTDNNTVFLKSKLTGRWWMQMPDQSYIPCSYNDYQHAVNNEIPERWMREQERLL
ncbi:arginase [Taibaiella sp. KBW10]|uniref:formimidoylglutamase n=1 Tax=Taibaiella sp. KBW10 TaxID=2153357 RepID=UPI000F5A5959|nr:formimidoylglutamase [Taibaiella sp. KBW10]RQO30804.1 arginase [Taibaiella sp. KBW10]